MKKIFLFFIAVVLILPVAFLARKEEKPKFITMCTAKTEIKIELGGSGFVTIDWGDGTPKETRAFDLKDEWLIVDYEYGNDSLRTITITGDNITKLICYGNQLLTLDVCGFTRMEVLHCADNELSSLTLTGLYGLKKLQCYGNQLTSLNLIGLPRLEYLACRGNQLTSLNINKLGNLEFLDCGDNNITATSLDTLLASLPIVFSGTIDLSSNGLGNDNSGTIECNKNIAVDKGWTVYY